MYCMPSVVAENDHAFWVTRKAFFEYFDQDDFRCRTVKQVVFAYLRDWFHPRAESCTNPANDPDATWYFDLPAVGFLEGRTDFLSTRHRTAVLLEFLDPLPISFAFNTFGRGDRERLDRITTARIDMSKPIWLPDLPIRDTLP